MHRRGAGFTLVELLIVITILVLLIALLAVLIPNLIDRARYGKTNSIVQSLESSCKNYKTDFGAPPPVSLFGQGSSKNLHWHLGIVRYVTQGSSSSTAGGGIVRKEPGYIQFQRDWLKGSPANTSPTPGNVFDIVDAWGNAITYHNPSPNATNPQAHSFRIVSMGADESDPSDDTASDIRDF